ncbi:hypothetical protein TrST_g13186 [Triparma strigata]|uniref:Uncharacterized protein n=1 Tax=Triparma strigata TaxID=1606541 RepID=A0A9W7EY84_9STRA|nr:hypothetical protein TrST_g13186 [Triparma strigata]
MKRSNASMTHKGEGGKEPAATKPAAAKPTAAKPASAKWVVPSFFHTKHPGSAQKTYNAMSKVVAHLRSQPQP